MNISENILSNTLTTLAYGWRLERRDGITVGFTSHDQDQIINGITLAAQPGLLPTKIISSLGTQSDGLDIEGTLSAESLREEDLRNGRWDGAKLHIFLYDWKNLDREITSVAIGELGEVSSSGETFNAELLGLTAQLDHDVAPVTSPMCRARFGDRHCKLNRHRFSYEVIVDYIENERIFLTSPLPGNIGDFAFGELRWLNGSFAGLSTYILDSDAQSLSLIDVPKNIAISAETARVEITMGCNKSIAVCSNRFGNAVNFRGEPYLPGNDLLTRYPGAN